MRLDWVELERFRNLQRQKICLHPRFNLLLGPNGQGKTNFLEAVAYLGSLRSFRTAGRNELIRHGENMCRVSGGLHTEGRGATLAFTLSRKGRTQFIDNQKVSSPEKYLQPVRIVHFIPEDVGLIGGSPSRRRKVIDRSVFDTFPGYTTEYRRYLTTLRHRNALLRKRRPSPEEKKGWDNTLAETGSVLVKRRWDFLLSINPVMKDLGGKLGLGEGLHLAYSPSFESGNGAGKPGLAALPVQSGSVGENGRRMIAKGILEGLDRESEREMRTGHSLVGPHRAVLAFKMALARVVADIRGEWPLIILDDVSSELDNQRREALGCLVRETKAQFLISTTGEEFMFLPAEEGCIWHVENGRLQPHG
jgi:DNA replication and repair protein RecF